MPFLTNLPWPQGFAAGLMHFLGELARPYVLYATGTSFAVCCVMIVDRGYDLEQAAWFVGALGATLTGLYAGKALENTARTRQETKVAVAKVNATPTPPPAGTATITTAPDVDISVRGAEPESQTLAQARESFVERHAEPEPVDLDAKAPWERA